MRLRLERLEQRNLLAADLTGSGGDIYAFAPSSLFSEATADTELVRSEHYAAKSDLYQDPFTIAQDKTADDSFETDDDNDDELPRFLSVDAAFLNQSQSVEQYVSANAAIVLVKQAPAGQVDPIYSDVDRVDTGNELANYDEIDVEDDPIVKTKPAENANDSAAANKLVTTSIANQSGILANLASFTVVAPSPQDAASLDSEQALLQVTESMELNGESRTQLLDGATSDSNGNVVASGVASDLAMHQLLNDLDDLRSEATLMWDDSQVAKLSLPIAVAMIAAEIARRRFRHRVTPPYESTDEHLALWMYPECSGLAGRTPT